MMVQHCFRLFHRKHYSQSPLRYVALMIAIALSCIFLPPGLAIAPASLSITEPTPSPSLAVDTSISSIQTLYEHRQFDAAVIQLQRLIQTCQTTGDWFGEAIAQRNLALVYLELGNWADAQTAIDTSLQFLQTHQTSDVLEAIAQTWDVQGKLQLAIGQADSALESWERALGLYQQLRDPAGIARATLNQVEALHSQGMYRRAIATLDALIPSLPNPSLALGRAMRSLGDALRATGDLTRAEEVLTHALAIVEPFEDSEATALTHLSLGHVLTLAEPTITERVQTHYQQAREQSASPLIQLQAQLGLFQRLSKDGSWQQAQQLIPDVQSRFDRLPASHALVYARIYFVQTWLELEQAIAGVSPPPISVLHIAAAQLATARQQAQWIQDGRAEAYALGNLGSVYRQTQQWQVAETLTEQALNLAQQLNADDISYLWQWELGQILSAEGKQTAAIAAYGEAIHALQQLQKDLIIAPEVQLSFRSSIEPIHRQFVQLLLNHSFDQEPDKKNLEQARVAIESLQLAELNDFFRDACLTLETTALEQLDQQAAIIYPIMLPDRLEVIFSLPGASRIQHTTVEVTPEQIIREVRHTRDFLSTISENEDWRETLLPQAQTLYNWLVRPFEPDLAATDVKTLVFVLDQQLRNIPMSVLHNGQQYLIERYSVAVAPGLELLAPTSQQRFDLRVLMAGLSEERSGFSSLQFVPQELAQIRQLIPDRSRTLLNQEFTATALKDAIATSYYPVVHLATHGKFSPNFEESFLLTGDGNRLDINQLRDLLQTTLDRRPLELLVLSACETAISGTDPRATLGLAGIAVRSGAKSTVATLWQVSDESTALLMTQFYQGLVDHLPKAEALRQAQLALLNDGRHEHPFFWSAVILIGNWT